LARSAVEVTMSAVLFQLGDVPANCPPTPNLSLIVRAAASAVISAIPLKPATRIFVINPTIVSPHQERLRGVHAKEIQLWIVPLRTYLGNLKPLSREFSRAIAHVLAPEHSKSQQLLRREFRAKIRMKTPSFWFSQEIEIAALHQVVHNNSLLLHDCVCFPYGRVSPPFTFHAFRPPLAGHFPSQRSVSHMKEAPIAHNVQPQAKSARVSRSDHFSSMARFVRSYTP
jgi:hypothetical protein